MNQANRAREHHKLLQIAFEPSSRPCPLTRPLRRHVGVTGSDDHPGWRKLIEGCRLVEQATEVPDEEPRTQQPSQASRGAVRQPSNIGPGLLVDGMTDDVVAALTRFRTISVVVGGSINCLEAQARERSKPADASACAICSRKPSGGRSYPDRVEAGRCARRTQMGGRIDKTRGRVRASGPRSASVASAIEPAIRKRVRRMHRPTKRMGSYDLYLRASALPRLEEGRILRRSTF